MKSLTVYARTEPTTDLMILAFNPTAKKRDVVIYSSPECRYQDRLARFSWFQSKPTRRNKRVAINCFSHPLVWID